MGVTEGAPKYRPWYTKPTLKNQIVKQAHCVVALRHLRLGQKNVLEHTT